MIEVKSAAGPVPSGQRGGRYNADIDALIWGMGMPVMEWNETLVLDRGVMDETHREFIDLLNRLAEAPETEMLAVLDEFIAHTEAHFGQEQRWMEQMAFPPTECHVNDHVGVLQVAQEVRKRAAAGETRFGPILARAVAEWFATHAASMDHVLALYMKEVGFNPRSTAGAEEVRQLES